MYCRFPLVTVLAVSAAGGADRDVMEALQRQGDRLFHKTYVSHTWREEDHTVDGNDWSLPAWVNAAAFSGISINPAKLTDAFPGRLQRTVRVTWRELEPTEGHIDLAPLRERILEASESGRYAVKMGLLASVWETRYVRSVSDRTITRTAAGSAPRWLRDYRIDIIEEPPNRSIPFQVVNLDIYNPAYHERYLRLVQALGISEIPRMRELDICYVHLRSASRGEEGRGPDPDDPARPLFEERLRTWSAAFKGVEYKLCNVSHREEDLALSLELGMGQRNGFVEHYMLHAPNPMLGQLLDERGYLVVDEANPLIAENRASGDENEEYTIHHVQRFGPLHTFAHRYRESMLRALQMRRNFLWGEGGPWLINPPLLHYVALELGKTVQTAPDAWCYLRESYVPDRPNRNWRRAIPVKNFERWLYQRDSEGAHTRAVERVDVPEQMFEYHPDHRYDDTARSTDRAAGQTQIRFNVHPEFLPDGPHRVAVKVTYIDRGEALWELRYRRPDQLIGTRTVRCGNTGRARTTTFILPDAEFRQPGPTWNLAVHAVTGDAVIRFVRLIKLTPPRNQHPAN